MSALPGRCAWGCVAVLSLVGLGLATYLTVAHVSGNAPACSTGGGCEAVTTSQYAAFVGIPVAGIGVVGYSVLLIGSLVVLSADSQQAVLRYGLLAAAAAGFLFSAYLTATQAFMLQSYCIYCLASAVIMTAIFLLTIYTTLEQRARKFSG